MTEYRHVTASVKVIGIAKINLSKSRLFVDESAKGWARANELVRQELAKDGDKSFYKVSSRTFLWNRYFKNSSKVKTLGFWEEVLEEVSNRDELDVHTEVKAVIRKTLLEVIEHYLNADCVLLPMVAPRSKETPSWHAQEKANIYGQPYEKFYRWYREDCSAVRNRMKGAGARYRFIFSSVRVPDCASYTKAVDKYISKGILDAGLYRDAFYDTARFLQLLASKCPAEDGNEPFANHLSVSSNIRSAPRTGVFNASVEVTQLVDPIQTMKSHLNVKLAVLQDSVRSEWVGAIEDWITSSTAAKISTLYNDIVFLCEWMASNGLADNKPQELNRRHFVQPKQRGVPDAFFGYLKGHGCMPHAKSRIVRNLVDFFAHCSDAWLDETGQTLISPLNESDKKRFPDKYARERGKSNKPVLPRRIIEMAKKIIVEDDYSFARKLEDQYVKIGYRGAEENLFVPTISNLLFLILSLPIRTAQAVMLDSGEADDCVVSLEGKLSKNKHPLAQKGRKLGYARRFVGATPGTEFCGVFVNTNKEQIHAQKGYEIPFHDSKLMEILAAQRLFQEKYNPVDVLINRSQLSGKDWKYQGSQVDQLESYTFMFRDIRKGSRRWDLPTRPEINRLWLRLLQEVQSRLECEGTPVQLVWIDGKENLRTEFTLHSLRVSNITHFIEAGVPLHVLAEFLSGHQTLVMTLYYTKLGPRKIHEVIAEASKNLAESDEDEFFDRLCETSDELLSENLVGMGDGHDKFPSGDPGLWHIDIDGICTSGKTLCEQGFERKDLETGVVSYERIRPDGFNCALCRFYITGPAFLAGQVTLANTLLYSIRQRSEQQEEIYRRVKDARARGNNRAARKEQDFLDKVTIELEERIASLGTRIANIYSSLDLMNEQDERGFEKTALVTKLDPRELEARVSESSIFESVEWASQALEFFPQLPDSNARFRKGILLERMAEKNGLKRLLLKLSDDELLRAGNRLTIMMTELYGAKETDDLMSGRLMLEEIGGLSSFETLVGRAIQLVGDDIDAVSDQSDSIGIDYGR
ncbi:VPA1269 family protein [Sulfitobacter sp. 1A12157]|uniref:VPA1269 family protein n=1 Tax=Sulfitobacter sp. 1A12157 TaxID=3368594 RepID=UPI00374615CF